MIAKWRGCTIALLVGCTASEPKSVPIEKPMLVEKPVLVEVSEVRPPSTTWLAQWAGQDFDEVNGLAITPEGDTLAVGGVAGAVVLSSAGFAPTTVMAPLLKPNRSGLLVKYGQYGDLRFAVPFALTDDADAVAATPDGGAVVVGSVKKPLVETDGPGLYEREEPDGFVARFDAAGKPVWRRVLAGPSTQTITEVAAHPQGGYVVAGVFHGDSRFDGDARSMGVGMAPKNEEELGISYDVFVARLAEDGEVMWIGELGSEEQEVVGGVAVGADGTVVLTGECRLRTRVRGGGRTQTITCGDLSIGGFLATWRADGELEWATRIPGPERDTQSPMGVTVLADGSIVAVGLFKKGIGGGALPLLSNGDGLVDGFVVAYTAKGQPAWLRHLRGPSVELFQAAVAAPGGGVWVLGNGSADMEFGDGTKYEGRVPRAGNDALLLRYDAGGELVYAGLYGGKPAPRESSPTVADADMSEVRPYALAVAADGSLRIGGSFDGGLALAGDGAPKLRASADLDGFVIAVPAP